MAKRTRNILFAIFILIFIIVTPLVCLYATGYQIGQNFSIQKTGILVVKTAPREANVYLENKTQKKLVADLLATDKNKSYLTPAKIKGLLSGEYDITINKDNYWPWNKKLVINPGQSLYLENITLFKNSSPALLTEKNYSSILPSPDRMYLLAIYPTGVDIVDLNSNKINNLDLSKNIAQPIAIEKCSWSPDSKKFAVAGMVYDLADLKPTNLNEIIKKPLSQLQWDDSQADQLYYYSLDTIYNFNLITQQSTAILADANIIDFFVRGNDLFTLSQEGNSSVLKLLELNGQNLIRKVNLPLSDYVFINKKHSLINLLDRTHKILYLIDPLAEIKPVVEIINNVSGANWVDDKNLIFFNDFEIWFYNLDNYNKYLIIRISEEINTALPFINKYYLLYSTAKDINVLELDARDKYNITKLISLEKNNGFFLSPDGQVIYFSGAIDNRSGVYKLEIQ